MASDVLYHHGILGQHWGVRRFQKEDGTRTPLGERHRDQIEGTISSQNRHKSKSSTGIQRTAPKKSTKSSDDDRISIDKKELAKVLVGVGAGIALSYAKKALPFKKGKNAVDTIIKNAPTVAMYTGKGFKANVKVGKSLIKLGGTIAKAGVAVANDAAGRM